MSINVLQALMTAPLEAIDLDDVVCMLAIGEGMEKQYQALAMDAPEVLADRLKALRTKARDLREGAIAAELKDLESREAALKTAQEKRDEIRVRKERLLAAQRRP